MFVVQLLTPLGYRQTGLKDEQTREKALRSGHIVKDGLFNRAVEYMKGGDPAIVPLRHPYLVAESWRRRGKPLGDMKTAYRRLPALEALGAYFLPLDIADRWVYLEAIKTGLGLPIKTDWPVINSHHSTSELSYTDITPDADMLAFRDEMGDFLKQFYRLS